MSFNARIVKVESGGERSLQICIALVTLRNLLILQVPYHSWLVLIIKGQVLSADLVYLSYKHQRWSQQKKLYQ